MVRTHNNFSPIFHKFNPQKVLQNSGEYEHGDSKASQVFTCFRIDPSIGRFLWRR